MGEKLVFLGFLDQHQAIDADTDNRVNIVRTTQVLENGKLPLILDIDAFHPCQLAPEDWVTLLARINSLRSLKNQIFRHTLTRNA